MQIDANQCKSMQIKSMHIKANQCKSIQINANQYKSMQINANQCKSMQINANQCKSMQINANQIKMPRSKLQYDEPIKGDCCFVDADVTGSVEGTSDKPKVALRSLFEKAVLPRIAELVKPGGEHAGFIPLIQGDNTGFPHQYVDFVSFSKNYCADNGWYCQPPPARSSNAIKAQS
jgi:hypothetical protein